MQYHVTNNKRVIEDKDVVLVGAGERKAIAVVSLPLAIMEDNIVIGSRIIPESMQLGHFFGMHIGNGWCDASHDTLHSAGIHLATIHENQKDIFISYVNAFLREKDVSGYKLANSYHDYEGHNSYHGKASVTISDSVRNGMISTFGHGANNKTFPLDFLARSEEFRYGLLSGLIDTDGSISVRMAVKKGVDSQNKSVMYATQSWTLAKRVQMLCFSLGINASITIVYRKERHEFTVVMSTEDIYNKRHNLCLCSGKDKVLDQFVFGTGVTAKDIIPLPQDIYAAIRKRKGIPSLLCASGKQGYITRYTLETHLTDEEKQMLYDRYDMSNRYDIVIYTRSFPDGHTLTEYEEIRLIEEANTHVKKTNKTAKA